MRELLSEIRLRILRPINSRVMPGCFCVRNCFQKVAKVAMLGCMGVCSVFVIIIGDRIIFAYFLESNRHSPSKFHKILCEIPQCRLPPKALLTVCP